MKHFLNNDLLAPNVLTVPLDVGIVAEFAELARAADLDSDYCGLTPWSEFNDIRWVSGATERGFARFESAYRRLDLARHVRDYVDVDRDVRFYAGFLHVRSACLRSNFHVDWQLTNNEGFTLLTPINELETGQKLLYKKLNGEVAEYQYRLGEGIIFGDHFLHSTPPGRSEEPFALLVFNFGTDKMVHWNKLLRTQGHQCPLVKRPDGEFMTIDPVRGALAPGDEFDVLGPGGSKALRSVES